MTLAYDIKGAKGELLLASGTALDHNHLRLLRQRDCMFVDVNDGLTDDIEVAEVLSERVRLQVTAALETLHAGLRSASDAMDTSRPEIVQRQLQSREFARTSGIGRSVNDLADAAAALVDEVRDPRVNLGLNQIRFYDDRMFQHSISTAVAATILGRELDWDTDTLTHLAVGTLLHDIGNIFIDREIITKAGKLDPNELEVMKLHPQIGYQAVLQILGPGVLSNHVPFQHYERQDGTGYPRGLRGTNRLINPRARGGPDHILPIAQVAAVADVYDTLNPEGPYHLTISHDHVMEIMSGMGGTHLNAALVDRFMAVLELYPPGTGVVLHGPQGLEGCSGVVVRAGGSNPNRPIVRLLYDATGRRLNPFDLALEDHPELSIEATLGPNAQLAPSEDHAGRVSGVLVGQLL